MGNLDTHKNKLQTIPDYLFCDVDTHLWEVIQHVASVLAEAASLNLLPFLSRILLLPGSGKRQMEIYPSLIPQYVPPLTLSCLNLDLSLSTDDHLLDKPCSKLNGNDDQR